MKDERGFALVITLLITALLVALSAEFVDEVFVDTSARQNYTDGQQASIMAGSGIELVIRGFNSGLSFDYIATLLAKPIVDETGSLLVTIEDESGKVNLNLVSGSNGQPIQFYDVAKRLLKNTRLSLDLLDTLTDWVDDGPVPPQPAGAKNSYYNTLKPPYDVKSGKLETVEELRLIKGFDASKVKQLRQFVTVYDDCIKININTAPKEVIAALADGITDDLATSVVDQRPFKKVADLQNVAGMDKFYIGLQGYISVDGTAYRITSTATVNETTRAIEVVVRASDRKILYWREY